MLSLPASVRAACWLNAWLSSRESADAVISELAGPGLVTEFVGPEPDTRLGLALFLGDLRRRGVRRVSTSLPVPGDPLGLGGPATFNADALEAGEAVLLHGADLGLVPSRLGDLIRWDVSVAHAPSYLASVGEADRALRQATAEAAERLAALDVASWRPDVADILLDLREPAALDPPVPFATPQAARLAQDALRAGRIVALAERDDGGAVSVSEVAQRAAALQPLDRASRAALVAATSSLDGR